MKKGTLKKAFITACAAGAMLLYPNTTNYESPSTIVEDDINSSVTITNNAEDGVTNYSSQFTTSNQTPDICNDTELQKDAAGITWINVNGLTKDGISLQFNLSVKFSLSKLTQALDKSLCLNLQDQIFHQAQLIYEQELLNVNYADLPEQAQMIAYNVIKNTEDKINSIFSAHQLSSTIVGLAVNNVKAPGLTSEYGKALLEGNLRYTQSELIAPYKIETRTEDKQDLTFQINITYQEKQAAYERMGPNKEGIKRGVINSLSDVFNQHAARWKAQCIVENSQYFRDSIYTDAAKDPELSQFVYLTDLKIIDINSISNEHHLDNGTNYNCSIANY